MADGSNTTLTPAAVRLAATQAWLTEATAPPRPTRLGARDYAVGRLIACGASPRDCCAALTITLEDALASIQRLLRAEDEDLGVLLALGEQACRTLNLDDPEFSLSPAKVAA